MMMDREKCFCFSSLREGIGDKKCFLSSWAQNSQFPMVVVLRPLCRKNEHPTQESGPRNSSSGPRSQERASVAVIVVVVAFFRKFADRKGAAQLQLIGAVLWPTEWMSGCIIAVLHHPPFPPSQLAETPHLQTSFQIAVVKISVNGERENGQMYLSVASAKFPFPKGGRPFSIDRSHGGNQRERFPGVAVAPCSWCFVALSVVRFAAGANKKKKKTGEAGDLEPTDSKPSFARSPMTSCLLACSLAYVRSSSCGALESKKLRCGW
ncbi:hypothetical protein FN846DRAFT_503398 [Sphaerosporella brunnea]|uniref:Uncharacterized protein n=1 Tax=Sphaerosporella brunnea TaxID=1250544 RepID=A0A5J5EF12_9PEZI|nr:hypothetical protein FN846DRAFT_503398 [Sphaerosporella brunnea]